MIALNVNGKKTEIEKSVSITDYLGTIGINPKLVVVELNYEIPDREKWSEIMLVDGDNIEVLKFIGGG